MKSLVKILAGFLILVFLFFISCDDKNTKKESTEKSYSLFCWPSKTPCDNLEYGIEFSYTHIVVNLIQGNATISYPRVATLVCCSHIEELIDSLESYNDLLKQYRAQPLGDLERRCNIGPDIEVHVNYSFSFGGGKPYTFATMGFKDKSNPYGFDLEVPKFEYFDDFKNDVLSMYRKCCLWKEDN